MCYGPLRVGGHKGSTPWCVGGIPLYVTPSPCHPALDSLCRALLCCIALRWQSSYLRRGLIRTTSHRLDHSRQHPRTAEFHAWDGMPAYETQVPRTAVMWRLHMHTIVSRAPCAAGRARGGRGDTCPAACCCRYRSCACYCVFVLLCVVR